MSWAGSRALLGPFEAWRSPAGAVTARRQAANPAGGATRPRGSGCSPLPRSAKEDP